MRVPFPRFGLHTGAALAEQPLGTSFSLSNVRLFDTSDERDRGGQRAGTALAYTTQVVGDYPILHMCSVTSTYIQPA